MPPPKSFDFSPSLEPGLVLDGFGSSLRLDLYSYKVDSVSNKPERSTSSSTLWSFTISVVSSFDNAKELARELGTKYPEDFRDITISTSRYATIGAPGSRPIVFAEMKFLFNVYTSNEDWIRRDAPPTTLEGLLGFPAVGENLSYEEIVELLVNQRAPLEERKPYRPQIVRPGTEIGYVNVPFNRDGISYPAGAIWALEERDDAVAQELLSKGVLDLIPKDSVTNYNNNNNNNNNNKPRPEPEKKSKEEPPRNRVIRQRQEEDAKAPVVLRRVIKRR
jgi:hypothetical protein